jgi:hypothetical protein
VVVRRLRTIDEAAPPVAIPLDGRNLRSAIELSELCLRLRPVTPPRGVQRFASIEDAQEHRRRWETAGRAS